MAGLCNKFLTFIHLFPTVVICISSYIIKSIFYYLLILKFLIVNHTTELIPISIFFLSLSLWEWEIHCLCLQMPSPGIFGKSFLSSSFHFSHLFFRGKSLGLNYLVSLSEFQSDTLIRSESSAGLLFYWLPTIYSVARSHLLIAR